MTVNVHALPALADTVFVALNVMEPELLVEPDTVYKAGTPLADVHEPAIAAVLMPKPVALSISFRLNLQVTCNNKKVCITTGSTAGRCSSGGRTRLARPASHGGRVNQPVRVALCSIVATRCDKHSS